MPKRILIFALTYLPFIGGAEVAIKEITDRLDPSEYEFDLVTLRFDSQIPKQEKLGNVNVYRIGFAGKSPTMADLVRFPLALNKYLFPFAAWWKARSLHRERGYEAIWSMMANYAGFAALFFKLSNPRTPFLLTLQEGDPILHIKKRVGIVYPLFKQIFNRADMVQTISNYLADFARSMGFSRTLEVIPNGVAVSQFDRPFEPSELEHIKKEFGKKEGDVYLITASRLVPKNAIDDIIRALEYLPQHVKLLVVGTGPDQWALDSLSKELGFADRVIFLGHRNPTDIPKYLKVSDIFVRPSLSEGMGNAFIEAMAAGIPVIATPIGGIVDFLFDPDRDPDKKPTGLLCNVRDPKSIADKVGRLLSDEALKDRIRANAKDLAREKYDWDKIVYDMRTKVFQRLIS